METLIDLNKESRFPKWAAALTDQDAFRQEQERLGSIWTFLGLIPEVSKNGSRLTARLGGRSVVVQRFGDKFEALNRGAHPIEVATCGSLIFGRFQHPHTNETLQQFLGAGWPIIETMCTMERRPRCINLVVEANWKLSCHISLDDYHLPAIHPTTFGKDGYLKREALQYFRFGSHSAFFPGADENALQAMTESCKDGTYRPVSYRIFQFFPNLLIAQFRAQQFWYVNVHHFVPIAPGRSVLRSWYYRAPFETGWIALIRWLDAATEPVRAPLVGYFIRKLHSEDNEVVERMQRCASQQGGWPRLGYAEQRIKWFEEAYAQAMAVSTVARS